MSTAAERRRLRGIRLIWRYLSANLQREMGFRSSFLLNVGIIFVNEVIWLSFWSLFFTRFPNVQGWTRNDVLLLWAVTTTAFGLVYVVFGNVDRLPDLITNGQLDHYLMVPKPPLLHVLVSRTSVTAIGDVLFGISAFLLFGNPTLIRTGLFLLAVALAAVIVLGYMLVFGSLPFYLGNTQRLNDQVMGTLIHFSTYPGTLFKGTVKLLLYTALPAGFIHMLPVSVVRTFDWQFAAGCLLAAAFFLLLGRTLFYAGLRRYESGSVMSVRL